MFIFIFRFEKTKQRKKSFSFEELPGVLFDMQIPSDYQVIKEVFVISKILNIIF